MAKPVVSTAETMGSATKTSSPTLAAVMTTLAGILAAPSKFDSCLAVISAVLREISAVLLRFIMVPSSGVASPRAKAARPSALRSEARWQKTEDRRRPSRQVLAASSARIQARSRSATTNASLLSLESCRRNRARLHRSCTESPPCAAMLATPPAMPRPMPSGGRRIVAGTEATARLAPNVVPKFCRSQFLEHSASKPSSARMVSRCTRSNSFAAAMNLVRHAPAIAAEAASRSADVGSSCGLAAAFAATNVTGMPSHGGLVASSSQHSHSSGMPLRAAFHARRT
mmetsp:Transcript_63935/g.183801  ORF Transcript_63935/g.183801 Transcript_63935/m.183801 type:complete len:285 (+) Transcript_63935:1784-2638(+)